MGIAIQSQLKSHGSEQLLIARVIGTLLVVSMMSLTCIHRLLHASVVLPAPGSTIPIVSRVNW